MAVDADHLASAVRIACRKAEAAAKATVDDGSASADLVHVPVGQGFPIKRRDPRWRTALDAAGYVSERDCGIWRGYLIDPGIGRASARLAACRAMAAALKSYGASVYHARD